MPTNRLEIDKEEWNVWLSKQEEALYSQSEVDELVNKMYYWDVKTKEEWLKRYDKYKKVI